MFYWGVEKKAALKRRKKGKYQGCNAINTFELVGANRSISLPNMWLFVFTTPTTGGKPPNMPGSTNTRFWLPPVDEPHQKTKNMTNLAQKVGPSPFNKQTTAPQEALPILEQTGDHCSEATAVAEPRNLKEIKAGRERGAWRQ